MTRQQETTITVSRSPRFGALWQFCKIRAQRSSFQLWMMLFNTIASARRGTDSKKLPPISRIAYCCRCKRVHGRSSLARGRDYTRTRS
jgi:hypothetical protein